MKTAGVMQVGRWVGLLCVGWFAAGTSSAQQTPAPDMMGARKVLEAIAKAVATTNAVAPADASSKVRDEFKGDLDRFRQASAEMAPEKAASDWLSLFDRFWKLPPDSDASPEAMMRRRLFERHGERADALSLQAVIAALPEPSAWDALAAAVEKRTPPKPEDQRFETSLRLFTDYLTASAEKLEKDVAAYESQIADLEGYERDRVLESLQKLRKYIDRSRQGDTAEAVAQQLEKALEAQKAAKKGNITLKVPDLVSLVGEKRAESIVVTALETPGVRLEIDYGEGTMALARRLCLERVDKLLEPQWALVNSPDAVALYEGLAKKFSPSSSNETAVMKSDFIVSRDFNDRDDTYAAREAKGFYVIGLLAQNRVQDAFAFVTGLPKDDLVDVQYKISRRLDHAGSSVPTAVLFDFCGRMVKTKAGKSFWSSYISLAIQMGKSREMIELLSAEAARTDLTFTRRVDAYGHLVSGYLAADLVDDAVRVMRLMLQMDAPKKSPDEAATRVMRLILQMDVSRKSVDEQAKFEAVRMEQGIELARLGRLLDKPEWVSEGIAALESTLNKKRPVSKRGYDYEMESNIQRYWQILMDDHQYAKAEALLVDAIAAKLKSGGSRSSYRDTSESFESELTQLAEVYYRAGRYGDILELFEKAPWWGAEDLVGIQDYRCQSDLSRDVMAAEGLRSVGRAAEAIAILKARIYASPGDDDAYALLIKLSQEDLIPWLDTLYRRDRFEERPLIWKAHLLMKAGKLDDAEKVILEALRVDPTDGETAAGNRVRAYAVMSEIKAAKGKKEDAKFFADVVESVRIAEHGDELTDAGLITRSIAAYEKAQDYFADAYCVQWRLAKRFDDLGKTEEAEKHYQIAFERMPEQFGQVASFCFGCEGAFESKHSQSTAEKVLLGLEKAGPKRPQVYYLLGQLREAQRRYPEAYAYYRKAVEMDAGYLDAWKQIDSIADQMFLPQAERDSISLEMFRMDPLGHHAGVDLGKIGDLRKLWEVVKAAPRLDVETPKSLLPLVASAARIKATKKESHAEDDSFWFHARYSGASVRKVPKPGDAVVGNDIIKQILELMENSSTTATSGREFDFEDF